MPALPARVRLSASNDRASRARLAPSATRIASCGSRATPRASVSPATLTAATSHTSSAAPVSSQTTARDRGPVTCSPSVTMRTPRVPAAPAGGGVGARQDRLELALRWFDGGAGAQPADHEPRAGTRRGAPRVPVREQRVRLPHVGGEAGLGHRVRQHADDPRRLAVDQHRRPEDGVRPAEAGAPESMAQEREPLTFLGVAIGEEAPAIGDHAEQAEQVRRDACPADLLELAGVRERHRHGVEHRHVREAAALPAPRLDGAEGGSAFTQVLIGNFDPHHRQAIGRWERQRPQQDRVQHAEHRRAGADGEGQRHDRAGGEARAAAEAAQGVAKLEEHDGDLRSAPSEHATPRRDGAQPSTV